MKYSLFILLSVLTFIACNNNQSENEKDNDTLALEQIRTTSPEKSYLIAEKTAGNVRVGEALNKLPYFKYEIKDSIVSEEGIGYQRKCAFVSENDEILLFLWLNDSNKVDEIKIISEKYKTAQQVGVGSSLNEIIKSNDEVKIYYTYETDRYFAQTDKLTDIQFNINPASFLGDKKKLSESDNVILKPSEFNKDAKIVGIRIF